jgi:hypothetical protein
LCILIAGVHWSSPTFWAAAITGRVRLTPIANCTPRSMHARASWPAKYPASHRHRTWATPSGRAAIERSSSSTQFDRASSAPGISSAASGTCASAQNPMRGRRLRAASTPGRCVSVNLLAIPAAVVDAGVGTDSSSCPATSSRRRSRETK